MTDTWDGLILLDKPGGESSFRALGGIKRRLDTGKVGHAGTLDPFAEGLLLVLTGRLTRLLPLFVGLDKTYEAVFTFGTETDTLDPEGRTVADGPVPGLRTIEEALPSFLGDLEQVPPIFSAVHSGGQRAHRIARAGGIPRLAPRRVTVHGLDLLSWEPPRLTLAIRCSKGTYVRSLARDLGLQCGTRAHVSALRRTRIGDFRLEEAVRAADFQPARDLLPPARFLDRLGGVRRVTLPDALVPAVLRGQPLSPADLPDEGPGLLAFFARDDRLLALASSSGGRVLYRAVLGGSR